MPTIPYHFPMTEGGYLDHLRIDESQDLTTVRWKYVDLPICHAGEGYYPSLASVAERTPSFHDHRSFGFTLGMYSEFFVFEDWGDATRNVTFFLGDVEVSLGDATPLAQYLYDGEKIEHYHPPFSNMRSIRVLEAPVEFAEQLLLHATIELKTRFGMRFHLFSFHNDFVTWDDEEPQESQKHLPIETVERLRPFFIETTPLRALVKGLSESEPARAILQFFRVLEYFSLVPYEAQVETLRQKTDFKTRDFLVELQKIIAKNEKDLLCGVIGRLADAELIASAKEKGLVSEQTPACFCSAMYEFRNSLVHAKSDRPGHIYTEALFRKDKSAADWREICEELALRALQQFGRRCA